MKHIEEILNEILPGKKNLDSQNLIEDGVIDSFDLMCILDAIEKEYRIEIDIDDMEEKNFKNVASMEKLITKYMRAKREG